MLCDEAMNMHGVSLEIEIAGMRGPLLELTVTRISSHFLNSSPLLD